MSSSEADMLQTERLTARRLVKNQFLVNSRESHTLFQPLQTAAMHVVRMYACKQSIHTCKIIISKSFQNNRYT